MEACTALLPLAAPLDAQQQEAAAVVAEPVAQQEAVVAAVAEPVAQQAAVLAAARSGVRQPVPSVDWAEITAVRL